MSVSDNYVVQYLLQATLNHEAPLVWTETDSGFRTLSRDVGLELDIVPSRAGERIYLSLTLDDRRYWIAEPLDLGLLGSKYESDEAAALAGLLRELVRSAAKQCAVREDQSREPEDGVRDMILHRLLFDTVPPAREDALPGSVARVR